MSVTVNSTPAAKAPTGALKNLVKAVATGAITLAGASPTTALLAAVTPHAIEAAFALREKKESGLSSTAWDIVRAAYASALVRFLGSIELDTQMPKAELEELISQLLHRASVLAEQSPHEIRLEHFYSPLSFYIFRDAAKRIPDDLAVSRPKLPARTIRLDFEKALVSGLQEARESKPKEFLLLEQSLQGALSIGGNLRQASYRHREFLFRTFTQDSVFGQEISGITLSDLYIRQRCTWTVQTPMQSDAEEIDDQPVSQINSFADNSNKSREEKKTKTEQHLADLHSTVDQWLTDRKSYDHFRVVAGGGQVPGNRLSHARCR